MDELTFNTLMTYLDDLDGVHIASEDAPFTCDYEELDEEMAKLSNAFVMWENVFIIKRIVMLASGCMVFCDTGRSAKRINEAIINISNEKAKRLIRPIHSDMSVLMGGEKI